MTREIKFRAIDEMNVWWYFTLEDLIRGDSPATTGVLKNWCQSTGLHDKNGKEIYEGDILRHDFFWGIYTVIRINGMFIAKDKKDSFFIHEYQNAIEVIEDIYSTPELLTNSK